MKHGFILIECIMYVALILLTTLLMSSFLHSIITVAQKASPDSLLSQFEKASLLHHLNTTIESASIKKDAWHIISAEKLLWHESAHDHEIALHNHYLLFSKGSYTPSTKKLNKVRRSYISYKSSDIRFQAYAERNYIKGISVHSLLDIPPYFIPCLSEHRCLFLQ